MSASPSLTCSRLEISGRVATFIMDRPDALNALSMDLKADFKALVDWADGNEAIGALVIAGEGRAFCAGGDVKNMTDRTDQGPGPSRQSILSVHEWLLRLHNIDCPVIVAVDGLAFGGGFSLALAADLVFASEKAKFCAVFARIGLMPDMGLAYTLPRAIGPQMAKDLMFSGRSIGVEEAQGLGLVHSIHPAGQVLAAAEAYATRLAEGPKTAQALTKRLVNKSFERGWQDIADAEADGQTLLFTSDFSKEAIRRFLDKEPALYNWDAKAS
jgi:2-(1,2-epoxy-1,2-dihydrophenyl)acetyl-CoA isomerase